MSSISQPRSEDNYNDGNKFLSVLLEGNFKSAYSGRIKPFNSTQEKQKSISNKLIIVSDGDVISNDILKGQPTELGIENGPINSLEIKNFY